MTSSGTDEPYGIPALAEALREAELSGIAVPPPSTLRDGLTLAEAYEVQAVNIRKRLDAGESGVGHKIGLTSLAMQKQLGVDQPDFGVVTDAMVIREGEQWDASRLIAPRAEAEFAFLIGEDLGLAPDPQELSAAIAGVACSIEIIDSRVVDWRISLVDTVADNASCARIAYGAFTSASVDVLDALPDAIITMTRDDDVVASGPGSAVLGHPLTALEWLSRAIGAYGERFRAGDVVLAGAVAAAVPLTPGSVYQASAPGLAPVSVHVPLRTQGR